MQKYTPIKYIEWLTSFVERLAIADCTLFCVELCEDPEPEPDPEPAPKPDPEPVKLSTVRPGDKVRTRAGFIISRDDGKPVATSDSGDRRWPYQINQWECQENGYWHSEDRPNPRDIIEIIRFDGEG